jgi:hypothetical protein
MLPVANPDTGPILVTRRDLRLPLPSVGVRETEPRRPAAR